jgi:tripartite-type tricarboxylate transporter receptor subunit TctC
MKPVYLLVAATLVLGVTGASYAQDVAGFPNRPIRLVVPFVPGGTADTIARIVSDRLFVRLGRPIVLDTRAGANSVVGCDIVAQSNPDGHTLIIVAAGFAVNPSLRKTLPYDSVRDFAPVGLVGNGPYLLTIHSSIPASTVSEFIAWGKARPGQVSYASTGVGSPPHLAMELLKTMAGVDFVHVPYKGGGAVLPDLLSGRVPLHFSSVSTAAPHVRAGRLRAIAMTTPKRSAAMPEVPTFDESGLKGYDVTGWYGLLAPGKTPPAIIRRLNHELQQVLADAEALKRLAQAGIEPAPGTPASFAALIKAEIPKWAKVIKAAGVEPE